MYVYVGNNPVNYTDPTGHCPWCVVGAVGGGVIGGISGGWYGYKQNGCLWCSDTMKYAGGGALGGAIIGGTMGAGATYVAGLTSAGASVAATNSALVGTATTLYAGGSGLSERLARAAVTTGTGIQHGFSHVNTWLRLGNWSEAAGGSGDRLRAIVEKVLIKPDEVIRGWEMTRGKQVVDVFLQKIGEEWLAVYYNPATQQIVTTTQASAGQLANWGIK